MGIKKFECDFDNIPNVSVAILDYLRGFISHDKTIKYNITLQVEEIEEDYYKNGEVIEVDFGESFGYEPSGIEKAVVVQNDKGNRFSPTLIVAPIASSSQIRLPTDKKVKGGIAKTNSIMTIDKERVKRRLYNVDKNMNKIVEGILYNLGYSDEVKNAKFEKLKYKRGHIVFVDFGKTVGSEQRGLRPALIIQNNVGNNFSETLTVVPITSKSKKKLPTHFNLNKSVIYDSEESTVLFEQIKTVDKSRVMGVIDYIEIEKEEEIQNIIQNILFN